MDFRSINKFNVVMNTVSGNFLPTTGKKTGLGLARTSYLIFVWIVEGLYLASTTIGQTRFVPPLVAIRDGGISAIVGVEVLTLVTYLAWRYDYLRNLIGKIDAILVDTDDLKRCIRDSVAPHRERLKLYTVATFTSVIMWATQPMPKILRGDQHSFTYTDFVLATYYPGAPFSVNFFFWGIAFQTVGALYLICKKSAIDIYVSYLITLLTAEYRYVNIQLTEILGEANDQMERTSVIASLRKCVQHHCLVMEAGQMLSNLLSVNVGVTYINCIVRICFICFSCLTVTELSEQVLYVMYLAGTLIQVFMLCLCGQELLDASTTITDDAFHEDWYGRGNTVMSTFFIMGLGDRMKRRLSAFGIVDLAMPTFRSIINQAYTICLLLLRVY